MVLLKQTLLALAVLSWGSASIAGSCLPPVPPWMPTDPDDIRTYVELLRRDAETYFTDVEHYFRCLDQERREVFDQARDVSEGFARVLEFQGRARE